MSDWKKEKKNLIIILIRWLLWTAHLHVRSHSDNNWASGKCECHAIPDVNRVVRYSVGKLFCVHTFSSSQNTQDIASQASTNLSGCTNSAQNMLKYLSDVSSRSWFKWENTKHTNICILQHNKFIVRDSNRKQNKIIHEMMWMHLGFFPNSIPTFQMIQKMFKWLYIQCVCIVLHKFTWLKWLNKMSSFKFYYLQYENKFHWVWWDFY